MEFDQLLQTIPILEEDGCGTKQLGRIGNCSLHAETFGRSAIFGHEMHQVWIEG